MAAFNFIVGTFNTPCLYTLSFTPSATAASEGHIRVLKRHDAVGSHSWLAMSKNRKNLYATTWLEPSSITAYAIHSPTDIQLLNTGATQSRSGYVCCSDTRVFSAGGAKGDVFAIDPSTGAFVNPHQRLTTTGNTSTTSSGRRSSVTAVQQLEFVFDQPQRDDGSTMDFGGIRHGAHSADLSPNGQYLYVADIGRNCIWTYSVQPEQPLKLVEQHISPRKHDGPRHTWPHPNGNILYVLQEHSSMVDVFEVDPLSGKLQHIQGVRIIPRGLPVDEFWADEVRTSFSNGDRPQYLYASTRGLKKGRKGYLAVYKLSADGLIEGAKIAHTNADQTEKEPDDQDQGGLLCMYETTTSGGWANAVQPGPTVDGFEYLALTDSEVGYVFVLSWNGEQIREAGRINLNNDLSAFQNTDGNVTTIGAATALWL